jgi:hypothetical protein
VVELSVRNYKNMSELGIDISKNIVKDEYKDLVDAVRSAERIGDAEKYFDAIYSLSGKIGRDIDEENRGRSGDLAYTNSAAGRVLRDASHSEMKAKVVSGEDWIDRSDTLANDRAPHYADDSISTTNSKSFGEGSTNNINERGGGYVTAKLVAGEDDYYNGSLAKRHSPWMVEISIHGFKKDEAKLAEKPFDLEAHRIPDNWK